MWGKNSSKNDVEVEVSLDATDNLFSIVVTEDAKLQSVVSVPMASRSRTSRRRFLSGGTIVKKNSSDELTAKMASSTSHRLADSLRPLSPNMNDRHSALEDSPRGRGRGRGLSCPPSVDRSSQSRHSSSDLDTPRQRLQSCPPNSRHGRDESEPTSSLSKVCTLRSSSSKSKKPNLVSKAASRNRLFGGGKRKVIPAPTKAVH